MSDLEDSVRTFLRRWSRRKRTAETRAADDADSSPEDKKADTNVAAQGEANFPAFDPATLPPIGSITATSDIRPFLAPGVPEELTRAALRRVWVTDPAIRDFIGIAENQWDFTRPDSVPGFGSLELTPELRRMVASLIGDAPEQGTQRQEAAERAEQIVQISEQPPPPARTLAPGADDSGAEQSSARTDPDASVARNSNGNADEGLRPLQRKHGGAVPR